MGVEVMKVKRKSTTQQPEWPTTLYLTPDRWSSHAEVYVVDERELRRMVKELRKLGEDWRKVSVNDAVPVRLAKIQDDDTAIYGRGVHPIYGGGTFYLVQRHRSSGKVWYEWEQVQG
jgi:hypothetical protein